jgi:nucleoside-diphosphate-sugar epimerase
MECEICDICANADNRMNRVILLTGSNGFVGRQVLRSLDKAGISVRLVIREGSKLPVRINTKIENVIRTPDLFAESEYWWANTCYGVDTILHAAWYTEPGKYQQSPRNKDCLNGTLNLARGCIQAGVRRFVGIGTCLEYDLTSEVLCTQTALNPLTPYAQAKVAAYRSLKIDFTVKNIEFAWCRLFYLYGEGEDKRRLVPYIHSKLSVGEHAYLASGDHVRDYLDVKEAGNMIAQATLSDTRGPINICSGIGVSIREFAEKIADEYDRRDLLIFDSRPDNSLEPLRIVGLI